MSAITVLLLGMGGLPDQDLTRVDFPRLRTWQFARALLHADVLTCARGQSGIHLKLIAGLSTESMARLQPAMPRLQPLLSSGAGLVWRDAALDGQSFQVAYVPETDFDRADLPAQWWEAAQADRVVSAGPFRPARAAGRMPEGLPVWVDVPGDPMAEAALRVEATGDPIHLQHAFEMHALALRRGDAFSTISHRQQLTLLGQLGLLGRVQTSGDAHSAVQTIPVGVEPMWRQWNQTDSTQNTVLNEISNSQGSIHSASDAESQPFIVLWPGAFNTWADLDTFFEGVAAAQTQDTRIQGVVTGGPIPGHEEHAWRRLQERVAAAGLTSRWTFTGWLEASEAAQWVTRADVGVCLDRVCLEAHLGSRTRVLYGASLGLPWILNPTCELNEALIHAGLATSLPQGDAQGLTRLLLHLVQARSSPRARHPLSPPTLPPALLPFEGQTPAAALIEWVQQPWSLARGNDPLNGLQERFSALEQTLDRIHHSPTWRILGGIHRRLRTWF